MLRFILGAVVGAAVALFWREDLKRLASTEATRWRDKAADGLESIEKGVDTALDATRSRVQSMLRSREEDLRGSRPSSDAQ